MIQFNRVTWYSRLMAAIFFICIMPALAFYIGRQYERTVVYVSNYNTYGN